MDVSGYRGDRAISALGKKHAWTQRAEAFHAGHLRVAFYFLRPSAEGELVADAFAIILTVEHCSQVGPAIPIGADTSIRYIHGSWSWWSHVEWFVGDFRKRLGIGNLALKVRAAPTGGSDHYIL